MSKSNHKASTADNGDAAAAKGSSGSSSEAAELFRLHNVRKRYEAFEALKGLTVTVAEGAIGLLGPNGAGKSTLIKTLLGLLPFEEGSATVLGHRLPEGGTEIRRQIGYMPENDCYLPRMTAVQYCAFAGRLCGMRSSDAFQRAHEMLHYVGLGEARYRKLGEFSTGMKQRAKLAQALVHGPKLVFLDEPTNGLDPQGRDQMLDLIEDVKAAGVSVVLSTHILYDVERVCERALLLNQGAIIHYGSIAEMRDDRKNNYEIQVRDRKAELARALGALGASIDEDRGNQLVVTLPETLGTRDIFQAALDEKVQIRHLVPYHMTLETAFLNILDETKRTEVPRSAESVVDEL
ncbi:MAG: ABC transporter ATP-binding protein [Myxococcota bacterium]